MPKKIEDFSIQGTGVLEDMFDAYNSGKFNIYVDEGGSRSGKTRKNIDFIILYCQDHEAENKRILIARQKSTWCKASVMYDFLAVLKEYGLYRDELFNKTESILRLFGCEIWFGGLDDPQKIHGFQTDIFWINEAIEATKDDFDQLEQRCQGFGLLDYNPSTDDHWIYDSVCKRDDVYFRHSTVFDNPFAPKNARRKILSYEPTPYNYEQGTADVDKWEIYGVGNRRNIEGLVFPDFSICSEIPRHVTRRWVGIDWGYTKDPTTILEVGLFENNIYCREVTYKTRHTIGATIADLNSAGLKGHRIWADTNQQVVNEELRIAGFNVHEAIKGQGSILAGIQILKEYKIHVTVGSMNMIKEFKNYKFSKDKNNKYENLPSKDYNHLIDPLRYVALGELKGKFKKVQSMGTIVGAFR